MSLSPAPLDQDESAVLDLAEGVSVSDNQLLELTTPKVKPFLLLPAGGETIDRKAIDRLVYQGQQICGQWHPLSSSLGIKESKPDATA